MSQQKTAPTYTGTTPSRPETVLKRLDEWIARTPDADAVRCQSVVLSYAGLDRAANRLAHELHEAGVEPDDVVGVVMDRSAALPVALLGVLRSGAGYLTVDPYEPDERAKSAFSVAPVGVVVTDDRNAARIAKLAPGATSITPRLSGTESGLVGPPAVEIGPYSLQYVIRTSGSTGRPKAIAMTHGPQARLIEWCVERYRERATVLQYFPATADVASLEIFGTWATGGCLVVATEAERHDIAALAALIAAESVSRVLLPVSVLNRLAEDCASDLSTVASLAELITTGERLTTTPALRRMATALGPDVFLDDHYGSSEVNVVVAPRLTPPAEEWPDLPLLGRPVVDARVYVLNASLEPAPRNVVGEIYIGGGPLARGYLGQGGLTAAAFVPDPFSPVPGTRMYRTGDIGRWRSGGQLEFMGRSDFQIKVRGHRVEPIEIEGVLTALPEVDRALVLLVAPKPDGRDVLTAYVTAAEGATVQTEELRGAVAAALPSHMVPEAFVPLNAMPLLATGKVDRARLPVPDVGHTKSIVPRDEVEEMIADVWCEVLGLDQVSVNDSFFALGGHSLLVTRVVYELRDAFDIDLSLVAMFRSPTVEGLAGQIRDALGKAAP